MHNEKLSLWRNRGLIPATLAVVAATSAVAQGTRSTATPARQSTLPVAALTDSGWPRDIVMGGTTITVYQPQVDQWDGFHFRGRAAVAVRESSSETPVYGIVHLSAETSVDRENRMVSLEKFTVTSASFPKGTTRGQRWASLLEARSGRLRPISLDRLEAALFSGSATRQAESVRVRNDPPKIIISTVPALLIPIDGNPVYRNVAGTSLERVLNTRPLILRDRSGTHYLKILDGWMTAESLTGSWTVAESVPADGEKALKSATEAKMVDLLMGGDASTRPSLTDQPVPHIYMEEGPAELIVTEGEPQFIPIEETGLRYAVNTTGNLFIDSRNRRAYVLVSGRWFAGPSSLDGPWRFVTGSALPTDFSRIPDTSPKENVKAAVPGTAQAQEAVIANGIPQTAKVRRSEARFTPTLDAEPKLEPIEGTSLQGVANSSLPIIVVPAGAGPGYFGLQNGVWFAAHSLTGPWIVATTIPSAIDSIPASSPFHHVTYVHVYDSDPEFVNVGYTPGYYGSHVSNGVVVHGTGYTHAPWIGRYWWGSPQTYGFGAAVAHTPWAGWGTAFGLGWAWGTTTDAIGWGLGPYPWWGPAGFLWHTAYPWVYRPGAGVAWGPRRSTAWGPGYWAGASGNVYSRWGSRIAITRASAGVDSWTANRWAGQVGASYNSRTGALAAGQRVVVSNVYTGNYAPSQRGTTVDSLTGAQVSSGDVTIPVRTGTEVTTGRAPEDPNAREAIIPHDTVTVGANNTYAGHDVGVYRKTDGGSWEQHAEGGWQPVDRDSTALTSRLDAEHEARVRGEGRTTAYQRGAFRTAAPRAGGIRRR